MFLFLVGTRLDTFKIHTVNEKIIDWRYMSTRYASFWVFEFIERLPWLNVNFLLVQSTFTRRTSLMKSAYLQHRLVDVILFPRKRENSCDKIAKNCVKIVKSAAPLWGSCVVIYITKGKTSCKIRSTAFRYRKIVNFVNFVAEFNPGHKWTIGHLH